jgi:hypothetical protein
MVSGACGVQLRQAGITHLENESVLDSTGTLERLEVIVLRRLRRFRVDTASR